MSSAMACAVNSEARATRTCTSDCGHSVVSSHRFASSARRRLAVVSFSPAAFSRRFQSSSSMRMCLLIVRGMAASPSAKRAGAVFSVKRPAIATPAWARGTVRVAFAPTLLRLKRAAAARNRSRQACRSCQPEGLRSCSQLPDPMPRGIRLVAWRGLRPRFCERERRETSTFRNASARLLLSRHALFDCGCPAHRWSLVFP